MTMFYTKLLSHKISCRIKVGGIFVMLCGIFLTLIVLAYTGVKDLKWHLTDIGAHAKMLELGETFRADVARMRYCEKNLFFNLHDPMYVKEYKEEWEQVLVSIANNSQILFELERDDASCLSLLNHMQLPQGYIDTFRLAVDKINKNELVDPVVANAQLNAFPHLARDLNVSSKQFVENERIELANSLEGAKQHFGRFQYGLMIAVAIGFVATICLTILLVQVIQAGCHTKELSKAV